MIALAAALLLGVSSSCSTSDPAPGARRDGRPLIAASIAPLADLARRVAGDRYEVVTIVPPGSSPHTWEPSPREVERLAGAQIVFVVGLGYESWLGKLIGGARGATIVDASEGVDALADGNPHYWLDPLAMRGALAHLADTLARLDPAAGGEYRSRADQTSRDLDALDEEFRERLARLASRELVTFHAAWEYFARRYGLRVLAAIEESPGREPGPRELGTIVRLVRENKVPAIFSEPQFPPKAAAALAAECGVPLHVLDPLGGSSIPGRGDYFSLLRYNVSVLEEALH